MSEPSRSSIREYERAVTAVREWIDDHYSEPDIRLDEFCQRRFYSRRSVQRALAYFDTTWRKEIREARMKAALEMLEDRSVSIRDVSDRVGFADRSNFARVFRQRFGQSPREFRRERRASSVAG